MVTALCRVAGRVRLEEGIGAEEWSVLGVSLSLPSSRFPRTLARDDSPGTAGESSVESLRFEARCLWSRLGLFSGKQRRPLVPFWGEVLVMAP